MSFVFKAYLFFVALTLSVACFGQTYNPRPTSPDSVTGQPVPGVSGTQSQSIVNGQDGPTLSFVNPDSMSTPVQEQAPPPPPPPAPLLDRRALAAGGAVLLAAFFAAWWWVLRFHRQEPVIGE